MVEQAAQALFEFVFACSKRLDGKHLWMNCDEDTKEGFRGEATGRLCFGANQEKDLLTVRGPVEVEAASDRCRRLRSKLGERSLSRSKMIA